MEQPKKNQGAKTRLKLKKPNVWQFDASLVLFYIKDLVTRKKEKTKHSSSTTMKIYELIFSKIRKIRLYLFVA
jgi:hypothetical protein